MGYFDSPKNRALWERELSDLEGEKNRRKQEGYVPKYKENAEKQRMPETTNPYVRRINLKELEAIEKAAREAAAASGSASEERTRRRTHTAPEIQTMENPELKEPVLVGRS